MFYTPYSLGNVKYNNFLHFQRYKNSCNNLNLQSLNCKERGFSYTVLYKQQMFLKFLQQKAPTETEHKVSRLIAVKVRWNR